MTILAHKDGDRIQTLAEHSYNVANLARDEASSINQGHVLFLLGLYRCQIPSKMVLNGYSVKE